MVTPQASIVTANGTSQLQAGTKIGKGDVIVTNGAGAAQLVFADETRIVVGPNSRLVIDDIILNQSNKASRFSVNALGGTFRFLSGKSAKSAYKIDTPTATMGIRGTIFDFYVEQQRLTDVVLFEGEVRICSRNGNCERTVKRCSLVEASSSKSKISFFLGDDRNEKLRDNFPYVVSQRSLRTDFRAPVRSCGDISGKKEKRKAPPKVKKQPKPEPEPEPEAEVEPEVEETEEFEGELPEAPEQSEDSTPPASD